MSEDCIESLERTDKKPELSANSVAFISCRSSQLMEAPVLTKALVFMYSFQAVYTFHHPADMIQVGVASFTFFLFRSVDYLLHVFVVCAGLISSARDNGIAFYYALSPGLDITYSSAKEVAALKRKLEQVSQFGCTAFALLFDDIEPEMSEADKEVFQSFAHAQVSCH